MAYQNKRPHFSVVSRGRQPSLRVPGTRTPTPAPRPPQQQVSPTQPTPATPYSGYSDRPNAYHSFLKRGLATGGGMTRTPEGRMVFSKGRFKGLTHGEATNRIQSMWEKTPTNTRDLYQRRADTEAGWVETPKRQTLVGELRPAYAERSEGSQSLERQENQQSTPGDQSPPSYVSLEGEKVGFQSDLDRNKLVSQSSVEKSQANDITLSPQPRSRGTIDGLPTEQAIAKVREKNRIALESYRKKQKESPA